MFSCDYGIENTMGPLRNLLYCMMAYSLADQSDSSCHLLLLDGLSPEQVLEPYWASKLVYLMMAVLSAVLMADEKAVLKAEMWGSL